MRYGGATRELRHARSSPCAFRCPGSFFVRDRGFMNHRKQDQLDRLERRAQRDLREKAAGKLAAKVPELASLSITMHETRPAGCVGDTRYIRRIVIESAPALFEVPCS